MGGEAGYHCAPEAPVVRLRRCGAIREMGVKSGLTRRRGSGCKLAALITIALVGVISVACVGKASGSGSSHPSGRQILLNAFRISANRGTFEVSLVGSGGGTLDPPAKSGRGSEQAHGIYAVGRAEQTSCRGCSRPQVDLDLETRGKAVGNAVWRILGVGESFDTKIPPDIGLAVGSGASIRDGWLCGSSYSLLPPSHQPPSPLTLLGQPTISLPILPVGNPAVVSMLRALPHLRIRLLRLVTWHQSPTWLVRLTARGKTTPLGNEPALSSEAEYWISRSSRTLRQVVVKDLVIGSGGGVQHAVGKATDQLRARASPVTGSRFTSPCPSHVPELRDNGGAIPPPVRQDLHCSLCRSRASGLCAAARGLWDQHDGRPLCQQRGPTCPRGRDQTRDSSMPRLSAGLPGFLESEFLAWRSVLSQARNRNRAQLSRDTCRSDHLRVPVEAYHLEESQLWLVHYRSRRRMAPVRADKASNGINPGSIPDDGRLYELPGQRFDLAVQPQLLWPYHRLPYDHPQEQGRWVEHRRSRGARGRSGGSRILLFGGGVGYSRRHPDGMGARQAQLEDGT